jgi:hypothetical protein
MKNPHPSGRPIRNERTKWRNTAFQYPAETFATPRLRPQFKPVADAIGYKTTNQIPDEPVGSIGFVIFP